MGNDPKLDVPVVQKGECQRSLPPTVEVHEPGFGVYPFRTLNNIKK